MDTTQQIQAGLTRAVATPTTDPAQYLTFMLGGEPFAIGILAIKEIIEYQGVTAVPMMSPFVRGVINLRGAVVPVIDLLCRFGRAPSLITKRTCVVIVEMEQGGERQVAGVIAETVNAVLEIPSSEIEAAPAFGTHIRSDFIAGMGKVQGRFVILIDLVGVLALNTTAAPESTTTAATALH